MLKEQLGRLSEMASEWDLDLDFRIAWYHLSPSGWYTHLIEAENKAQSYGMTCLRIKS